MITLSLLIVAIGFISFFALVNADKNKTKAIIFGVLIICEGAIVITSLVVSRVKPIPQDRVVVKEYPVTSVIMREEAGTADSKTYLVRLKNYRPVTFGDTNSPVKQLFIISGKSKPLKKIKSTVKIKKVRIYSYDDWVPFKIHSKVETQYIARITKTDMP